VRLPPAWLRWGPPGAIAALLLGLVALLFTTALAPPSAQAPLQVEIDRVQQRAAQLRELEPRGPVEQRSLPRSELRSFFEAKVLEDNSPQEIEANQVRWEVLGYVQPGFDLIGTTLDVLGEQVLGFYDPDTRALYIVGSPDANSRLRPGDAVTLAHEMTHALQDQYYDLKASGEALRQENDRQLALQALEEGDAILLQILYAQRFLTPSEFAEAMSGSAGAGTTALDAAPLVIQRELLFPYVDGSSFLVPLYRRGGWAAINRVWQNPPASTEQILHPEKYEAGEGPIPLTLPDLSAVLGPGWRRLEETTLGELDWRILFEQYVDTSTAERVGTGWGGDRFQLFKRDSDGAVVFAARTAWDSEADAREFFDAYPQLAAGRYGADLQTARPPDREGMQFWSGRAGAWDHELIANGSRVSLVISTDPTAASAVADALRP
jgi:hypothetical protein